MTAPPLAGGGPETAGAVDYLEVVRALAPRIAGATEQIERERRLPAPLIDAMVEAGLFRLLLPRPLGGAEIDPPRFVQVIEAVARIDASVAWCLCQNTVCSTVSAFLPPDAAREIFGRDPRAVLAWGPGPKARAVAVEGGYRVTGNWSFASGSRHATWLGGYCTIHEPDGTPRRAADGTPVGRTMLFPASEADMTDIWNVIGLKGTASDAYTVADLFVPQSHSVARDDQSERRYAGRLYCLPTASLYASGFACVALGIARSLLESFVGLAREKTPRGLKRTLRDNAVVQSDVAQAEAQLRAARMYLIGTLTEVWQAVERTGEVTLDQRMAIRLAATYTIRQAKAIAAAVYDAAGATAIFAANPFERRFRDMHAVAQQLQGRKAHFETVGQYLLGLDPDIAHL